MTDVGPEALGFLTVREVAARLGCSPKVVWRLVWREEREAGTGLESVKVGHLRRVEPEALEAYRKRLRAARAGAA